jgi:hypothetical protein
VQELKQLTLPVFFDLTGSKSPFLSAIWTDIPFLEYFQ